MDKITYNKFKAHLKDIEPSNREEKAIKLALLNRMDSRLSGEPIAEMPSPQQLLQELMDYAMEDADEEYCRNGLLDFGDKYKIEIFF